MSYFSPDGEGGDVLSTLTCQPRRVDTARKRGSEFDPSSLRKLGWWEGDCFSSLAFLVKNINKRAALLIPLFHKKVKTEWRRGRIGRRL